MICKKCDTEKKGSEFYANDKTCKECRKSAVRANRAEKADYYREYDKKRFKDDPRVKERHLRYQKSDEGRMAGNKAKRKWCENNLVKRSAAQIIGNSVRDGKIIKPDTCETCGIKHDRIHGHHDDYAYPMTVRWLCPKCHNTWHKENGSALNG